MVSRRTIIKSIAALVAAGFVGLAVFAMELGIDNDPGWGRGRYSLLALGLLIFAWTGWERAEPRVTAFFGRLFQTTPLRWLGKIKAPWQPLLQSKKYFPVATVSVIALALLAYAWVATDGTLTEWPTGPHYYHRLGQALRAGQFHLLDDPSPELLAVENPYDYTQRGNVPLLWDALFYEGSYYLYWGPVPGVLAAALQSLTPDKIRDAFFVLFFLAGYACYASLLARAIWQRFAWLPRGLFPIGALALTLNPPILWLLTRPSVYEAAIAGGQLFLIAGLYWAFTALLAEKISGGRLIWAGTFWALAAGTRVNLALPIILFGLLVIGRIFVLKGWRWSAALRLVLAFGIPLLLGAALLMGYNQARFGDVLEFGHRYQLTGPALPPDYGRVLSNEYIPANFYSMLLRPPTLKAKFPFLRVTHVHNEEWPALIDLAPDYYYSEPTASILLTIPILGLGLLALIRLGWLQLNELAPAPLALADPERKTLRWLAWGLGGSAALSSGLLLVFIHSTYRYFVDIVPALLLLAFLFLGYFVEQLETRRWEQTFWRWGFTLALWLTPLFGFWIAAS